MKLLLLMALTFFVSCQNLPHDRLPSANEHGLFNVELRSCKKQDIGTLGCIIPIDRSNSFLQVPTSLTGSYLIRSNTCGFFEEGSFKDNQILSFSYDHLLKSRGNAKECLYDVKIFIDEYQKSFRGLFKLTDTEDFELLRMDFNEISYNGTSMFQFRTGLNPAQDFTFYKNGKGTILINGCGKNIEKDYEDSISFKFNDLVPVYKKTCSYVIGMIPERPIDSAGIFSLTLNRYSKETEMVSKPRIWFKGDRFVFSFEHAVSSVMINDKIYSFTCGGLISCSGDKRHEVKVDYNPEMVYKVRMITTNGRYNRFDFYRGELIWKSHTILY